MVPPNSGLYPLPPDLRDRRFSHAARFGSVNPLTLPKEGLGRVPYKIVNQLHTNFCTAAGTSSGSEYQEDLPLSFEFQVAAISRMYGKPIVDGCDMRTAMKARVAYGALPDRLTPPELRFNGTNADYIADWHNWPQHLWDEAKRHRAAAFFKVD